MILLIGGSTLWGGLSMDTPSPREKKLIYDFLFLFIFCMYIRNDVNRWTPLSKSLDPPLILLCVRMDVCVWMCVHIWRSKWLLNSCVCMRFSPFQRYSFLLHFH